MSVVQRVLVQAVRDLTALHSRFAVVGGIAVGARTVARATTDVDFVIAIDRDSEGERLVGDLVARGYRIAVILEHTDGGRLATVRLQSPIDGMTYVDLLLGATGIEGEIVSGADLVEIEPGVKCRVASVGHLIAMKLLALSARRRAKDEPDLQVLIEGASASDLEIARAAVNSIAARGLAREKDIVALLAEYERRYRGSRVE